MPDEVYEVVSQAARYWFLFLLALIAWRSFRWLRRDRKQRKRRLRLLPDAGYVGELIVTKGNEELPAGLALPVSFEGILGCLRSDDLYVPIAGIARKHLWYTFDDDDGLRMEPVGRNAFEADGKSCSGRRSHAYLQHGSRLSVGEAEFRLRLFAGFEHAGTRYAPPVEDEEEEDPPTVPQPQGQTGVTFTPEQMAVIQQMQWAAAVQAMQAAQMQPPQPHPEVLSTEAGDFIPPPRGSVSGAILRDEAMDDEENGEAFDEQAEWPDETEEPYDSHQIELEPGTAFYPPEPDNETTGSDETEYEDMDASSDDADGDYPDAPKSLYVEPDEAAEAKRLVWDKYLKGGNRR